MIFHQKKEKKKKHHILDRLVYPVGFVEALVQGDWKNVHGGGDI